MKRRSWFTAVAAVFVWPFAAQAAPTWDIEPEIVIKSLGAPTVIGWRATYRGNLYGEWTSISSGTSLDQVAEIIKGYQASAADTIRRISHE